MLETLCHSDNAFVTLTYADDMLPSDLSLDPVILRNFLKRLRARIEPRRIRFYAVGEYGANGSREINPHYHVILFGYPTCLRGRSVYSKLRVNCCSQCDLIRDVWGVGFISLGTVTMQSAGYCCEYITKNMRRTDDARLEGRWPEFARMSLRPGLGYNAMWEPADTLMRYDLEKRDGDVPVGGRIGKRISPYGRYLRQQLRKMVGKDAKAPDEWRLKMATEMLPLRLAAREDQDIPSLKAQLIKRDQGRFAEAEYWNRMKKGRVL